MKNAQKPEKTSLGSLLNQLQDGNFVIPDFQREFEWQPWDVQELIKSIFLDYYIGSLLLWKGKTENFDDLSCEPVYGYKGAGKRQYIVLDGQQRLTAIFYACCAPDIIFPNRKSRCLFFVDVKEFMRENYDDAFKYDWLSQRFEKIINNPEEQYGQHIFPTLLLGKGGRTIMKWVNGYEAYWTKVKVDAESSEDQTTADEAQGYIDRIKIFDKHLEELERDFQISYIELDQDIGVEKVCDIFTQINSRGVRLDIFDLLNAMLRPKGIKLKELWREDKDRLNFAESGKMNVYVLQVMSILHQVYCSPKYLYFLIPNNPKTIRNDDGSSSKVVLVNSKEEFETAWRQSVEAIENALKILRSPHDYGVLSSAFMPYPGIIPIFSAIRKVAKAITDKGFSDVNRKIRKWYWASIFTNRYSSSAESTSAKDFRDLKKWFEDEYEVPAVISEFINSFGNLNFERENKKGTAIYNAIFNLLVIGGAKDWATFESPHFEALDDHHIVPASWAKDKGDVNINTILNRTPLTEETNRVIIRDRLPNEYLPELFEKFGENTVVSLFASHFISSKAIAILKRENFGPVDYQEFITERQTTIKQAIQDLLIKERIELEPTLRELDAEVEEVELKMREVLVAALGEDKSTIPTNLRPRAEERLAKMLKNDPSKNPEDYKSTSSLMEYFDLREYQQIICNKEVWPKFEEKFGKKELLEKRFGQLAELRNSLRHSRTVDNVIRKEGEASVIWFKNIFQQIG